jgi:hypothetical protein
MFSIEGGLAPPTPHQCTPAAFELTEGAVNIVSGLHGKPLHDGFTCW